MHDPSEAPFWSVMIPAYRPKEAHLRKAIESVLSQDPGPDKAQIQVIDDCSPGVDVQAMVQSIGGERVAFYKNPQNLGLAGCWNACIDCSRGRWVHILHQDDFVLPGFYRELEKMAERNSDAVFLASRSLYIDENELILGASSRLANMEEATHAVDNFFYEAPVQCPGVVVLREFYKKSGQFRSDLRFTLDCEMWARAIAEGGGVVTRHVLSGYRITGDNESTRLARSGEGLRDLERLHQVFSERYPGFDRGKARRKLCELALREATRFAAQGEMEAAKASKAYWEKNATLLTRLVGVWKRWRGLDSN
ncbi:MAG TPA: glycosyltransferase family 2 protein [Verrucomicrobiae bacterium]|jgi:glycosyltransferase involved in cell wall biosynthesis|nr:glycosyltransferase family 2 protein [Verrucomicrobiae bacterium]